MCGVCVQRHCCEGHEAMEVHLVAFLSAQESTRHSGGFPRLGPQGQVQGREPAGVAHPDQTQQLHSVLCNSMSFCLALWLCCSAAEI